MAVTVGLVQVGLAGRLAGFEPSASWEKKWLAMMEL